MLQSELLAVDSRHFSGCVEEDKEGEAGAGATGDAQEVFKDQRRCTRR